MNKMIKIRKMKWVIGFLAALPSMIAAEPVDHTVHQVRLRCEGEFENVTKYQRAADAPLNNPVRAMISDICRSNEMEITVARTEYMPDTPMELNDLVKRSAADMGRRPGVVKPMQSTAAAVVSQMPAKRLSFSAKVEGKAITLESVYFLKGQTLWTIQIAFATDEERRKKAEQILATIRYQP
jgi:hypothetical protein